MRYTFLLFLLLSASGLYAQQGYKIDFKIKGLRDSTVYLGYYLQEKPYIQDTAKVNSQGVFTFQGAKTLSQGVYMLIMNKSILFDMVIGPDQNFSMETSTDDYVKSMVVKGDEDNRVFFESQVFNATLDKEAQPFTTIMKDSTLSEEQKKVARENLTKINEKVMAQRLSAIDKYPNSVYVRMLKVTKPIPEPPKRPDGTVDSSSLLRYYRQHFFDNLNLADEAMLRMPKVFYWEKVKEYLNRLYIQHPDTITKAIDGLVAVAKKNKDTYRYLVWNCVVSYSQPEIMGMDEVFVNMVDKYIATGELDYWLDKKTVQNLKDNASKIRRGMIGRTGANLMMQNENQQPKSLYDIKNHYTIIFFFKPTCGHCREEAPKLVEFYNTNKKKFDFEVFAVATDTSMKEMKEFIRDMKTPWITVNGPRSYLKTHFSELYFSETTPTIYILDEKKKIIARKLTVEQLGDFFTNYEKQKKRGT